MKNKPITLLAFLMLLSFQSSAGISDASWYISVDIQQVYSTEIYKLIPADKYGTAPKNISHVTLYGDSTGIENATAIFQGDFTNESLSESVLDNMYTVNGVSQLTKEKEFNYKNKLIEVMEFEKKYNFKGKYKLKQKEVDKKTFYFSQIDNNLGVLSFDVNEVKNWIDNKYDGVDIKHESLFSVVVDVQSALAHMGMNIDKNSHMMQSEIFQKVVQVSASITEVNNEIVIDVALNTTDEETAVQIEQVINGLVAMNNLSGANDKNELHAIFMQNLMVERNADNISINSYAPIADIKKVKVKRRSFNISQKEREEMIKKYLENK